MPRTRCRSNLDRVAILEHDESDTRALTQQRFDRMTLAGGDRLPEVDLAGLDEIWNRLKAKDAGGQTSSDP